MSIKYSLVVPTYNEEKYLPALLASVAKQHPAPDQLIVVDGSTDQTPRLARRAGATVLDQTVKRVSWARKRGFEAATGEVIVSTDADSRLAPGYAQALQKAFADPRVAGAIGPVYLYDGPWIFRVLSKLFYSPFLRLSIIFGRPNFSGQNFAARRSAYVQTKGFDPEMVTAEDVYVGMQLRKVGRIVYVPGMRVYTSGRRISGMGGWAFMKHHTINFFRVTSGKTGSSDFKPYR